MNKKTFEKSLAELVPECGKKSVEGWIKFAEGNVERGQEVNFKPIRILQ